MVSHPENSIQLKAQCLCKVQTFTASLPLSSLPLQAVACHCNSCRHVTGALYSVDAPWPAPLDLVDTSSLSRYAFSDKLSILFCGVCSSPMFWETLKEGEEGKELGVFTGVLENVKVEGEEGGEKEFVKLTSHIFVSDTLDGGASVWLQNPNIDGVPIPRYHGRDTTEAYPPSYPDTSTLVGYSAKSAEQTIPIRCHCHGVDLRLHRGNYEAMKKEDLPIFVDPVTKKLLASFDVCDSCRLHSGVDVFHWTFAELCNISSPLSSLSFPNSTKALQDAVDRKEGVVGSLGYFESSPDVQRYFCRTCSTTVFYACDDRPRLVDIAIGVLDAEKGARAEGWLSWGFGGLVSHEADVKGGWREGFVKRVKGASEEWRVERGYPKNWRRVLREEREKEERKKREGGE